MAPSLSIFGDFTKDASIMYNNFRVYGTGLLMVMGTIVFVGVKFVNKFATVALACVIFSIIAVYVGLFVNFYGNEALKYVADRNVESRLILTSFRYPPFRNSPNSVLKKQKNSVSFHQNAFRCCVVVTLS